MVSGRIWEDFIDRKPRNGRENKQGGGHPDGAKKLQAGQHGVAPEVGKYSENGFHRSPRTLGVGSQFVKPSFKSKPIKILNKLTFEIAVL